MRPSVSVVIPCYRYGHYLEGCVRSVLSQEGVEPRVLIIDDASPDGSGEVAKALAREHANVEAWVHTENRGHIATYNEGLLGWADGDYVSLLSADDLLTPGSLARSVAPMEADPRVGMAYGRAIEFDGELPDPGRFRAGVVVHRGHPWLARRHAEGVNVVPNPGVVLRTDVQLAVGGYDPAQPHAGDLGMWLRVAAVADVAFVRGAAQAYYRVHARSMSQGVYTDVLADARARVEVFDDFAARHPDLPEVDAWHGAARRAVADAVLWNAARRVEKSAVEPAVLVEEATRFAGTLVPDVDALPGYRALRRRRAAGRWATRGHVFVLSAVRRRLARDLWWWRWRRTGG